MKATITTIDEMKLYSQYIIHEDEPLEKKMEKLIINSCKNFSDSTTSIFNLIKEDYVFILNIFEEYVRDNNIRFAVQSLPVIQRHFIDDIGVIQSEDFIISCDNEKVSIEFNLGTSDYLYNVFSEIFNKPFIIKQFILTPKFKDESIKNNDIEYIRVIVQFKYCDEDYINTSIFDYSTLEVIPDSSDEDIEYSSKVPDFNSFATERIEDIKKYQGGDINFKN